jgi:hypothetical protein
MKLGTVSIGHWALKAKGAIMLFNNLSRNMEAQTPARWGHLGSRLGAEEAVKDLRRIGGLNTNTLVHHFDLHLRRTWM